MSRSSNDNTQDAAASSSSSLQHITARKVKKNSAFGEFTKNEISRADRMAKFNDDEVDNFLNNRLKVGTLPSTSLNLKSFNQTNKKSKETGEKSVIDSRAKGSQMNTYKSNVGKPVPVSAPKQEKSMGMGEGKTMRGPFKAL